MRVLSGIQPTGRFHWGNYFGAIQQYIDLQGNDQSYYFIANLHALTTVRDPQVLAGYTMDAALDLLALGLDPDRATLFVQSEVPQVSELTWLLLTGTPMGLLERCHAYKEKKGTRIVGRRGAVYVSGADGRRHSWRTTPTWCQWAKINCNTSRFVATWHRVSITTSAKCSCCPRRKILDGSKKVPGTDGEKMSKSYDNTLELFEEPKAAAQKDHADHHGFAADGRSEGTGDRITCTSSIACSRMMTELESMAAIVSGRWVRLWRRQERQWRRRPKQFLAEPRALRQESGCTSRKNPRDS